MILVPDYKYTGFMVECSVIFDISILDWGLHYEYVYWSTLSNCNKVTINIQ